MESHKIIQKFHGSSHHQPVIKEQGKTRPPCRVFRHRRRCYEQAMAFSDEGFVELIAREKPGLVNIQKAKWKDGKPIYMGHD